MADPVTATVAVGWGMKAVGWLASPIISDLFKKGSSFLGFDASEKLKELEPKVLLLERLIEVVEESPYRPRLEQLLQELKSTFHEAEDILDDVEYHHLERQIHEDKFKSDSSSISPRKSLLFMKKFQSALPCSPLKNKETGMSKIKLMKTLDKVEHIINDAWKTVERLDLSSVSDGNNSGRQSTIATGVRTTGTPPLKVFGRDEDRDRILAMLHEKDSDVQSNANGGLCFSVVGIHGISGSGKSTLAQLVCAQEKSNKKEKRDGHFDLIMWVHVSQKFSMEAIYRDMIDVASSGSWGRPQNLDELQDILENALREKRFFLVLDDIWCNKDTSSGQNLPQLLSPLKAGKRGSKILVTCRNADALSDLGPHVKITSIPIHDLNHGDFLNLFMYYALGDRTTDDQDGSTLWNIGAQIAEKLKRSPLAASIVGGQLRKRKNVDFWRRAKHQDLLNETMGALSWSYWHLDEQVRRCFAYCSIFPGRHRLGRDELVRLWVSEGLIRNTASTGKEMEDVGQEFFEELVSTSFLQQRVNKYCYEYYYVMHDLLHHLAERVSGTDCFRIENGWTGEVPRGVRRLFVDSYNGEMLLKRIVELRNLCTLFINRVGVDTPLEEKALENMFKSLRKLRVLSVGYITQVKFSIPASIDLLKHLRFLLFRMGPSCKLILPSTFTKLYQMQMLDFGSCNHLSFPSGEEIVDLINLRYATTNVSSYHLLNISRSTSLQELAFFSVWKNHKIKHLRDLNKIRGSLRILSLQKVNSKEEALEAKLADKERLTKLGLVWYHFEDSVNNPEVEAEVLDGLCPPMCLEALEIRGYSGVTYPNWMVDKESGSPKYLQELELSECRGLGPVPELFEVFIHLRSFSLASCSWDRLPESIGYLKSLKKLKIYECLNIRSLPALPQSLETFRLDHCDEMFMRKCQTIGDPNWQKIQRIANREFYPYSVSSPNNSSRLKGVAFDDNVSIIGA